MNEASAFPSTAGLLRYNATCFGFNLARFFLRFKLGQDRGAANGHRATETVQLQDEATCVINNGYTAERDTR